MMSLQFDTFCRIARQLLDVDTAGVWLRDEATFWQDSPDGLADTLQAQAIVESLSGEADEPLWIADLPADSLLARLLPPATRFFACASFANSRGHLLLLGRQPRERSADDLRRLLDLGELAGQFTGLARAAASTAERENLFRLLTETSTDTIVRGDLTGVRLYISPSVKDLLGYEPEELVGRKAADITHPDDAPRFAKMMEQIWQGTMEVGNLDLRQRHKDGHWVWMEASVRLTYDPVTQAPDGYVASVRSMTRRKALESHLERLAHHDDLTGLANRAQFAQRFGSMIELARQSRRSLALLYMDLDGFKQVNDRHGHPVGDLVLQETASRLQSVMRNDDVLARLGGDEFAALMLLNEAEACTLAERMIATVDVPNRVDGLEMSVGLSVGMALFPEHSLQPEQLLEMADRAMYQAKSAGKRTYRVFSRERG